jgi:hypothetical protein
MRPKKFRRKHMHGETNAEVGAETSPATMARRGNMSTAIRHQANPSPVISSSSLNVAGLSVGRNATKGLIPAGIVDYAKRKRLLSSSNVRTKKQNI